MSYSGEVAAVHYRIQQCSKLRVFRHPDNNGASSSRTDRTEAGGFALGADELIVTPSDCSTTTRFIAALSSRRPNCRRALRDSLKEVLRNVSGMSRTGGGLMLAQISSRVLRHGRVANRTVTRKEKTMSILQARRQTRHGRTRSGRRFPARR